jgi:hypothetical protein
MAWRAAIPSASRRCSKHTPPVGPHHVGIDRGLADPGAESAIAAGDHVVAADEVGVARRKSAAYQSSPSSARSLCLPVGEREFLQYAVFMLMPGVGER